MREEGAVGGPGGGGEVAAGDVPGAAVDDEARGCWRHCVLVVGEVAGWVVVEVCGEEEW